jgi:predicted  nucleic acid-binding Zn-ribbon protein
MRTKVATLVRSDHNLAARLSSEFRRMESTQARSATHSKQMERDLQRRQAELDAATTELHALRQEASQRQQTLGQLQGKLQALSSKGAEATSGAGPAHDTEAETLHSVRSELERMAARERRKNEELVTLQQQLRGSSSASASSSPQQQQSGRDSQRLAEKEAKQALVTELEGARQRGQQVEEKCHGLEAQLSEAHRRESRAQETLHSVEDLAQQRAAALAALEQRLRDSEGGLLQKEEWALAQIAEAEKTLAKTQQTLVADKEEALKNSQMEMQRAAAVARREIEAARAEAEAQRLRLITKVIASIRQKQLMWCWGRMCAHTNYSRAMKTARTKQEQSIDRVRRRMLKQQLLKAFLRLKAHAKTARDIRRMTAVWAKRGLVHAVQRWATVAELARQSRAELKRQMAGSQETQVAQKAQLARLKRKQLQLIDDGLSECVAEYGSVQELMQEHAALRSSAFAAAEAAAAEHAELAELQSQMRSMAAATAPRPYPALGGNSIDTNGDGAVTQEEYALEQQRRTMDLNRDGVIDRSEFAQAYQQRKEHPTLRPRDQHRQDADGLAGFEGPIGDRASDTGSRSAAGEGSQAPTQELAMLKAEMAEMKEQLEQQLEQQQQQQQEQRDELEGAGPKPPAVAPPVSPPPPMLGKLQAIHLGSKIEALSEMGYVEVVDLVGASDDELRGVEVHSSRLRLPAISRTQVPLS